MGQLKKKGVKTSPREVANTLLAALPENNVIDSATVAGPGFINITLKASFVAAHISKVRLRSTARNC